MKNMAEYSERIVEISASELGQLNEKLTTQQRALGCGFYLAVLIMFFCVVVLIYGLDGVYLQYKLGGFNAIVESTDILNFQQRGIGTGIISLILSYPGLTIISLVPIIILAWMLKNYFQSPVSLLDPTSVRKKIITAPVEEQKLDIDERVRRRGRVSQTTTLDYKYTITMAGEKYLVTEENYYRLKPGQLAEIHYLISLKKPDLKAFLGIFPAEEIKKSDV